MKAPRCPKKVLVYPCGTEIGLEIHHAVAGDKAYQLFGGSSTYDHGRFLYENHIDNLPFITDSSTQKDVEEFNSAICHHGFDIIYPAMDGVLTVFARYRDLLDPVLAAPEYETCSITRSKRRTYEALTGVVRVPRLYTGKEAYEFPLFVKPDVGQGSVGASLVSDRRQLEAILRQSGEMLVCEYLPGEEYTVDCLTNRAGRLVGCVARRRVRTKSGISVSSTRVVDQELEEWARRIGDRLSQIGGWFFQAKRDRWGHLVLLEVASRIAGSSGYTRYLGLNLPLLTLNLHSGIEVEDALIMGYELVVDRALSDACATDLEYSRVYVDYDDTLVYNDEVNAGLVAFLYQSLNQGKEVFLLSRHSGDLVGELKRHRLDSLFDGVVHLRDGEPKSRYIEPAGGAVLIDDSYGERKEVADSCGIPVFDVHGFRCLMRRGE